MQEMKFAPEMFDRILDGSKTQTRRPCEKCFSSPHTRSDFNVVNLEGCSKYQKGDNLTAISTDGRTAIIRIKSIKPEQLNSMVFPDFVSEGFVDYRIFRASWNKYYKGSLFTTDHNPWVYVYEIELAEPASKKSDVILQLEVARRSEINSHICNITRDIEKDEMEVVHATNRIKQNNEMLSYWQDCKRREPSDNHFGVHEEATAHESS